MKTIELSKEEKDKMIALVEASKASETKLLEAQREYNESRSKYQKMLLFLVAKAGGEPNSPEGKQIAWEFIEEPGAIVGVTQQLPPQQVPQRMMPPQ